MVDDLVLAAELRVLVLDGVEAVRARRDHLANLGVVDRGHVGFGLGLEQVLVAGAARRIADALLGLAEHREVDLGGVQHLDERAHGLLDAIVERAGAADEQEVLRIGVRLHRRHVEPLGPLHALLGGDAPRVRVLLQVGEGARQLRRHARLGEHQVRAHLEDLERVIDEDRAHLLARAAGGAGPQRLVLDAPADERRQRVPLLLGRVEQRLERVAI